MSAATSPVTGLAYGLRRVNATWVMSPLLDLTNREIRLALRAAAVKASGTRSPRSRTALLVAIEADLEASPWVCQGYRKVWARHRVCRYIRVARKRVIRLMRENNLLSPHRCRRTWRQSPSTVRSSLMPRTSCGSIMAFGTITVDDGWGLDLHRRRALERRVSRLACLQARRPLRRPAADLHGACRAVWLDRGRRGSGAGLADGSRLPVSVGPLHQPDQVLGHPAVLRLRRRAPDQRRRRAVQSHAEGTDHPWSHLPQHRGAAGRRPRLRRTLQCPVDRRIVQRLPEPRSRARQAWHKPRAQSGPPRETNLCPRNRVRYSFNILVGGQYAPSRSVPSGSSAPACLSIALPPTTQRMAGSRPRRSASFTSSYPPSSAKDGTDGIALRYAVRSDSCRYDCRGKRPLAISVRPRASSSSRKASNAAVRGDLRTVKFYVQAAVKIDPKVPRFRFTHRVCHVHRSMRLLQLHDSYSRIAFSPH